MARQRRLLESNVVYHVFNRRTDRQCLFATTRGFEDFLAVMERAKRRFPVRLHAYCLMSTHWHFAVSAEDPKIVSACFQWVGTTHAVRFRLQTETRGQGHVYQDRFRTVPADGVVGYTRLVKYIEANPREAGLVTRAEQYRWSSLRERLSGQFRIIEPGPWQLPENWCEIVNTPDVRFELEPSLLGQLPAFGPNARAFPEFSPIVPSRAPDNARLGDGGHPLPTPTGTEVAVDADGRGRRSRSGAGRRSRMGTGVDRMGTEVDPIDPNGDGGRPNGDGGRRSRRGGRSGRVT